jgi:BMFP domain-containing protein YqiC
MASFTEATGAFGPKSDYEALAQQLNVIDTVRRDLGDNLDGLTTQTQTELNQLRTQVHALQQAAATPATPPKKVVVDNAETPKKATTTHKKKAPAPTSDNGSSTSQSSTSQPKSQ